MQNDAALALASSGIAATALELPLNIQINEGQACNITKNSTMAKIVQIYKSIVWEKYTATHKKSLDRMLKGFRQTLPVIPRSTVLNSNL